MKTLLSYIHFIAAIAFAHNIPAVTSLLCVAPIRPPSALSLGFQRQIQKTCLGVNQKSIGVYRPFLHAQSIHDDVAKSNTNDDSSSLLSLFEFPSFVGVGVTSILPPSSSSLTSSFSTHPIEQDGVESNLMTTFVGTKRGKLMQISFDPLDIIIMKTNDHENSAIISVDDCTNEGTIQILKPYPIFSMLNLSKPMPSSEKSSDHTNNTADKKSSQHIILTGGGDRYDTVWESISSTASSTTTSMANGKNNHDIRDWRIKTQLGPHTGWVKDLACIPLPQERSAGGRMMMIFSIGCNCIEVWKKSTRNGNDNDDNEEEEKESEDREEGHSYTHYRKLQIDSSVEMGCTLSSDLLCLATYPSFRGNRQDLDSAMQSKTTKSCHYLLAGGVDGRIHQWEVDGDIIEKSGEVSAHDGRVNGILICKNSNILVSIGNDGFVHCREMNCNEPLECWSVTSLCLNDEDHDLVASGERIKINSMCKVLDISNSSKSIIAIGTACGKVMLVSIARTENGEMDAILMQDYTIQLQEGGVIHALQCYSYQNNNQDGCGILIGCNGLFHLSLDLGALL